MTRKHYVAIAKAISQTKYNHSGIPESEAIISAFEELEERLVDFFMSENPNFQALKFYAACDPYEAVV
jgi:hypothetical protein